VQTNLCYEKNEFKRKFVLIFFIPQKNQNTTLFKLKHTHRARERRRKEKMKKKGNKRKKQKKER